MTQCVHSYTGHRCTALWCEVGLTLATDRFDKLMLYVSFITTPMTDLICIVGTDHTVILTHGGEIYTWGTGGQGQLGRVAARINERHMQVYPHFLSGHDCCQQCTTDDPYSKLCVQCAPQN